MTRKSVTRFVASAAFLMLAGLDCTPAVAAVDPISPEATSEARLPAVPKLADLKKAVTRHAIPKKLVRKSSAASLTIVSKTPTDAPDFDYQDRIAQAQALAASQPVLTDDMQFDASGNLSHFTWVLVVGGKTGPLTAVRMDESGRNSQGYTITWAVDNFINTRFKVTKPDGQIVFAQRRPVRAPAYRQNGYEEAVYTSYAPELDTRTMRAAGMDYLRTLQHLAYNRIQERDVRSRVAPNDTVAERIPSSMVVRLMIAEHIDPLHMKYVGIEQCIHEVLLTIAANKTHAYAYAKSSAGARGLPQFMEDSYQMVRVNYPKALLEPDFERGMGELRNAVLASVLLLDLELTQLPRHYLTQISDSSQALTAFLAAGYNRNPAHVVQTYHRTRSFTGGNAPFESKMYVRIQSWIGQFLKKEYGIA